MDEKMSKAHELYMRALECDRWHSLDLEEKLALMTVAIDYLERAWEAATLSLPADDALSFIKDIEYALGRIHRQRAYCIREWLRTSEKKCWDDFKALIESIYASGKPMSHFCLRKEEWKEWNWLPFDPSGLGLLSNSQKLKLCWKVLKMCFIIHLRG